MGEEAKQKIIEHYRELFLKYGDTPEGVQYSDFEGQRFRFEKLTQIADLTGRRVLDLGCGLGHLYPFLLAKFGEVDYTGIDIMPEVITFAAQKYPHARFLCRDILQEDIDEDFDYVLIYGVFNNAIPDCTAFLQEMISAAFRHCKMGLGFLHFYPRELYRGGNGVSQPGGCVRLLPAQLVAQGRCAPPLRTL